MHYMYVWYKKQAANILINYSMASWDLVKTANESKARPLLKPTATISVPTISFPHRYTLLHKKWSARALTHTSKSSSLYYMPMPRTQME